ncbi:MAG: type II toxin-antitoxin system prevent-host-death family antitoxin [Planctomycetota bacterium]
MKTVSINDLKRNLSGYIEEAVQGEPIVITKHRRPWAKLSAVETSHVWQGSRYGKANIKPVLDVPLPASAWRLIEDDRVDSLEKPQQS